MNFIAVVGFIFMLVLMCILVSGKAAPPVVFTVLPIIVSLILGFSLNEITEFIETGMASMLDTAVLFVFAISYFTLMSEMGLFDPMVKFLMKRTGKSITTILLAVMVTTFVAHLDGSGATTFLVVVPAFLPLCKKAGIRPQALLASMCGMYGVMNLVPWGRSHTLGRYCHPGSGQRTVCQPSSGTCLPGNRIHRHCRGGCPY